VIVIKDLIRQNKRYAKLRWGKLLGRIALCALANVTEQFQFSVANGDLLFLDSGWYVTHSGLTSLARRRRCAGIKVQPVQPFCDPSARRWAFEATVYKSRTCKGFVGFGDAEPSNISQLVHGAEMRVAETRAVCRALRKAYGVGICSVEEIGSFKGQTEPTGESRKTPQPANGNGYGGRTVRDHLCQIIRQHQLDPNLVKAYAVDFTGTKALRDATREQVEAFVAHLADWAEKSRDALLCQLNSYSTQKEGVA
jgi:hypothetical protein